MPKPRWKKPCDSDNDSINSTRSNNGNTQIFNIPAVEETIENNTDQRDNSKKLKSSPTGNGIAQHPIVDNKRKERNWKDHFGTTAEVTEFSNHEFHALEKKKSTVRYSSPLKKQVATNHLKLTASKPQSPHTPPPLATPATTTPSDTVTTTTKLASTSATIAGAAILSTTIAIKKSVPKKKGGKLPPGSSSQSTYTKKTSSSSNNNNNNNMPATKKKNTQRKRFSKEEVAPGGFLSSDITLFENPISHEDWICLFCQYDILMHGFEDAKKKNNFYQRKREKNKRIKEAESTRLSESEEDNHTNHNYL